MQTIIQYATRLTNTPAGSIALYNEAENSMELAATYGFSKKFTQQTNWTIRKNGLTERILNEEATVVINDVKELGETETPNITEEGIKSLIATPLVANRKTIGIIYVDDFKPREFTKKNEAILALLATQAATAIEKLHIIELTKRLAITDELTSLYNHRHFVNLYKEEMSRAKRYNRSLSVMLIDIDNFKHYNDTNGHLKGNDVLKEVSEIMGKNIRDLDLLARYGGEEFSVILPETDIKKAYQCAGRIRKAIEKHRFYGEKKQPLGTLTASIGISTYPEDAKSEKTLLDRADMALYQAKAQGRNKAVSYGSLKQSPTSHHL